jgi:hypothetical protein
LKKKSKIEKMRVGTKLIRQLSSTFYPNPRMVFDELISNSRDALATNVTVNILEDKITIEDDGMGMTPEELVKFFYISYTEKGEVPIIRRGNIKREIIGRFGIGKLSLYQICKSFDIETWRDGTLSKANFDFEKFEKDEFIDNFKLKVSSEKGGRIGSGTLITLNGLKYEIGGMNLVRDLQKTMPITSDFNITIVGGGIDRPMTLSSKDVDVGKKHEINEEIKEVGNVTGTIIYTKKERGEDFGIFIRIFGRLVNLDNPHTIVNFSSLTHARQFARKIIADLNVNGLNDALQTNRSGFIVSHPSYKKFHEWLVTKLNALNEEEYADWEKIRNKKEVEEIPSLISNFLNIATEGYKKIGKKFPNFNINVKPVGPSEPEASIDKKGNIIINSENPMYVNARSQGKLWGAFYHLLKSSIVLVAFEGAKDLNEFKEIYDFLCQESEKAFGEFKPQKRNEV